MDESSKTYGMLSIAVSWLIALLLVGEATATAIYVPEYEELFSSLGRDLPLFTKAVLMGPVVIWLLPAAAVGLIFQSWHVRSNKAGPLLLVFALGVLWVPAAIYGLYLPFWELPEVNIQ